MGRPLGTRPAVSVFFNEWTALLFPSLFAFMSGLTLRNEVAAHAFALTSRLV